MHHTLQVVDIDIAHHVGFADAEVRRGEYPYVEEIVGDFKIPNLYRAASDQTTCVRPLIERRKPRSQEETGRQLLEKREWIKNDHGEA